MNSNSGPIVNDPRRVHLLKLLAGTLSSIRRFPPEILSIIFVFCRDLDVSSTGVYTTTHRKLAPMLLTRICSRWRQIALDTPRLWDNVHLQTTLFIRDGVDVFVADLLQRSHVLPLSVTIDTPQSIFLREGWLNLDGLNDHHHRWLDFLWTNPSTCRRLRSLTLDVFEDDYTPNIFPLPETEFPALATLVLSMEGNIEPDLVHILESFKHAPLLRSLELVVSNCSDALLEATFPWHQLTTLNMTLPLISDVVRTLLVQCTSLERTKFDNIFEWDNDLDPPPPQIPTLLAELRDVEVGWKNGSQTDMVLGGLSLPKLRSLEITSTFRSSEDVEEPPTPVLLALHACSHFALEHLTLTGQLLTPTELLSVLRVVPTLRTLNVRGCECIDDELFRMLTANDSLTTLPELTKLEIHPITPTLDGNVVATMAESLFEKGRTPASIEAPIAMFPCLTRLCLYRGHEQFVNWGWEKFADDVERRIAVLCETGFLVDRYHR
ncbi:hypothetical protein R3P38DRAFT_2557298 [Favolaschia claudopus]|uniref:F-box domain-containing protein n=1 Tax=Favolaschia claudopus TaxID=2862362 RepID=A0AAW0A7Y4_9AGAR